MFRAMKAVNTIIFTLVLVLLPVVACAQTTQFVIDVGDFSSLVVQDIIDVVVVQDEAQAGQATFTTTKPVADCLIFTNNGRGRLKIEVIEDLLGSEAPPVVTVYSSSIRRVENDNVGLLSVKGLTPCKKFVAVSTGNGTINIDNVDADRLELKSITGKGTITVEAGTCNLLQVRVLGAATINAQAVRATAAKCHITGVGAARCWVEGGELNVKGNSSSTLYYKGNPSKITLHRLMSSLKIVKEE